MEGVLWKWTNYLSGWQPRWFVLDNGVLSYYKSQEDVDNGCKGSIKMNVCDIVVHPTDRARLDLIIPGEQHYYVKAATAKERQEWLVALGSAKATADSIGRQGSDSGDVSADIVRSKKSELRLYCDLLMQQVHSVKMAVNKEPQPDVKSLDEATSLLSATCDTFIQTLEDCMKIVQTVNVYEAHHVIDSPIPPSPTGVSRRGSKTVSWSNCSEKPRQSRTSHLSVLESGSRRRLRISSESSFSDQSLTEMTNGATLLKSHSIPDDRSTSNELTVRGSSTTGHSQLAGRSLSDSIMEISSGQSLAKEADSVEEFKDAIDSKLPTFFSEMSPSFTDLMFEEDNGIPVEPYLDACRSLLPLFDKLHSTAFAPVKMDFAGNMKKIQHKYSTDTTRFQTLQKMVLYEVDHKQNTDSNSATVALLWLKRGLEFILEFLREFCSGETDLTLCAANAYSRSLKPFHGWVVKGVFAVAVKALPYRETFVSHLSVGNCDSQSALFHVSLMEDIEHFSRSLSHVIQVVTHFYSTHSLDSQEQI
ncbi:pleckstrin homology domain-containing family A member 8-like [Gigantopelta aegis]|uniref:pleckstrin homology domain-containing family A member 8-like n=1 Tax=Gigantopelta aegis TaxID=1735272 RepID=UPI001B88B237|nr:pleckstrin homology domain-containing family A member 8-like [Gigantopelta aegis]